MAVYVFEQVNDIDMLEDFDVFCGLCSFRENRLDVFAIDLEVAPAARDVAAVLILEDDEAELLDVPRDLIEPFAHLQQQVFAHDAVSVL